MIRVVSPGARVRVGPSKVEAVVLQVSIVAGEQVQYQVAWWDGRERHMDWLDPSEVDTNGVTKASIGFYPAKEGT